MLWGIFRIKNQINIGILIENIFSSYTMNVFTVPNHKNIAAIGSQKLKIGCT